MITVCLASYNGEKFIKQQIESILSQISDIDELIISDDGSNDDTLNIINSFDDKRIILVHSSYKTTSFNFLNGIRNAKGDYIFLSDQDDVWKPNKVEVMQRHLIKNDVVFHGADLIDSKNNSIGSVAHKKPKIGFLYNFLRNRTYTGCCMAFNRELIDYIDPFPRKEILHDWWIGSVANILNFKSVFIPDRLISFRRHGENVSFYGESKYSIIKRVLLRIYLINALINRFLSRRKWRGKILQ